VVGSLPDFAKNIYILHEIYTFYSNLQLAPKVIIGNTSSNTIIDPFIGSGTTAVACELMRRKWIGFELNQEFCEIAVRRIKEETKQVEMAWMANKRLHGDPNRASQFPT